MVLSADLYTSTGCIFCYIHKINIWDVTCVHMTTLNKHFMQAHLESFGHPWEVVPSPYPWEVVPSLYPWEVVLSPYPWEVALSPLPRSDVCHLHLEHHTVCLQLCLDHHMAYLEVGHVQLEDHMACHPHWKLCAGCLLAYLPRHDTRTPRHFHGVDEMAYYRHHGDQSACLHHCQIHEACLDPTLYLLGCGACCLLCLGQVVHLSVSDLQSKSCMAWVGLCLLHREDCHLQLVHPYDHNIQVA